MTNFRRAALVSMVLTILAGPARAQPTPAAPMAAAGPTPAMTIVESAERALAKSLAQPAPKPARGRDSNANGTAVGAAIGGLSMLGVMAVLYSRCDAGCEQPAFSSLGLPAAAMGAGVGAVVGYFVDRAR